MPLTPYSFSARGLLRVASARRLVLLIGFVCLAVAGCATSTTALSLSSAKGTTLSVHRLFCQSCSSKVAALIETINGVQDVRFDRKKVEFRVTHDEAIGANTLVEAVKAGGFDARLGEGQGSYEVPVSHPDGLDVELISRGQPVDLRSHLTSGKVTVFDFYADWCGPCRQVAAAMNAIMKEEPRIALRKIDVIDWDTPVARQHLKRVPQLPFVVVYGPDGKLLAKLSGLKLEKLKAAINRGLR